jgi:hypothetical protein
VLNICTSFHAICRVTGQLLRKKAQSFGIGSCNLLKRKGPGQCYKTKLITPFLILYWVAFNWRNSMADDAASYQVLITLWTNIFWHDSNNYIQRLLWEFWLYYIKHIRHAAHKTNCCLPIHESGKAENHKCSPLCDKVPEYTAYQYRYWTSATFSTVLVKSWSSFMYWYFYGSSLFNF